MPCDAQGLSASIKGYVRDANTAEPVTGAVITIDSLNGGAFTDSAGFFILKNIPLGYHTLHASMIGYEKHIEQGVYVSTGRENILEISLAPADNIFSSRRITYWRTW
jgi:hypothetical protein